MAKKKENKKSNSSETSYRYISLGSDKKGGRRKGSENSSFPKEGEKGSEKRGTILR